MPRPIAVDAAGTKAPQSGGESIQVTLEERVPVVEQAQVVDHVQEQQTAGGSLRRRLDDR